MSLPTASPAAPAASLDHLAADTLFYLGPLGTYSHAVAQSLNARRSRPFALEPCVSITACAARAAQAGQLALLPYENSSFGPVGETNAVLVRQERLYVVAEAIRAVRHSLLCSPATLERLTAGRGGTATDAEMAAGLSEIFSHEQPIGQCRGFLGRLSARRTPVESTGMAAEKAAAGAPGCAAIASAHCAEKMGLVVLREGIQDRDDNETRFLLCTSEAPPLPTAQRSRALLAVQCRHPAPGEPGLLHVCLAHLAASDAVLRRISLDPDYASVQLAPDGGAAPGHGEWNRRYFIELEAASGEALAQVLAETQRASQESSAAGQTRLVGLWRI